MKPLILDHKTVRPEQEGQLCYEYDRYLSLNVVVIDGKRIPFIESSSTDSINLNTVTKVKSESDNMIHLTELVTRTKVSGEKDDHHFDHIALTTKTLVKTENDDTRTPYYQ